MGSLDSDTESYFEVKPAHRVTISQPFYLGKYQVTQEQWKAVMGDNPSTYNNNTNRPVEGISWHDVRAFIHKLNEREGSGDYSLPTEAQWEYACRAGTESPQYHHDIDAIAWYKANSNGQPQPVGQKLQNAWGLYDMLGNVWEWCHDGRREYTAEATVDPVGSTGASVNRVIRGGSWLNPAQLIRASVQLWQAPDYRFVHLGFRCARSVRQR
jgi:formylglycine-generating enzyme required for sulfatase activity